MDSIISENYFLSLAFNIFNWAGYNIHTPIKFHTRTLSQYLFLKDGIKYFFQSGIVLIH